MKTTESPYTTPHITASSQETMAADRRSFLKGTALVAGVAATGVLTAAAPAAPAAETSIKVTPRATMHVGFDQRTRPALKDLYRSLEEVLNIAGCPNCGLVGLDIRFGLDYVLPLHTDVPGTATLEGGILEGF
jgi:hypothetical protein